MEPPLQFLADIWREHPPQGRPSVTLSFAQSLDGCIAARRGAPLLLSGPRAMRLTHQLRAAHDAILVGIGTLLADNPRLTVRLVEGENPQPVVLDSKLRTPLESNLSQHPIPPWIMTTQSAPRDRKAELESAGMRVWRLPTSPHGRVDLNVLLARLAEREVESLMVEGGAGVLTSFLSARLADQVVITIAPLLVGGLHAVESLPFHQEAQASPELKKHFPRVKDIQVQKIGDDLIVWGRLT